MIAQVRGLFLRELHALLLSPMSYLVWAIFLVASGYLFATSLRDGGSASMASMFTRIGVLLLVVVPLLTMRSIADEARTGTLDVLLSDPVTELAVVLTRYAATLLFLLLLVLPTAAYPLVLALLGQPDPGPVLAGYVGLGLLLSAFVAVGLASSAVTGHPVAAGALSFTLLLISWMLGRAIATLSPGPLRDVLSYASSLAQLAPFRAGVCDTRLVVYSVTVTAFFLLVAVQALALRRLR